MAPKEALTAQFGDKLSAEGILDGLKNSIDVMTLNGKTVSMLTGAPFEDLVSSKVPEVGEFTFFSSMPDMLLVAGTALVFFAAALFLVWLGLWIAIGGSILTVRLSGAIYRGILGKKGDNKR